MNYKKFALLAVAAGMVVGCGKTPAPAAPDWSAEVKSLIAEKLYGAEIPYFLTDPAFGSLVIEPKPEYGAVLVDGGTLESSESLKAAADFLKDYDFVDLYEEIRGDADYPFATEWTYPMQLRLEVDELGPRYVNVNLSGQLPEENESALASEEPAEPSRYFHCEIFDPYTYTWSDSSSSDLIAYAFGSKDSEGYHKDATIASEIESYLGQSTYMTDGNIYVLVESGELYAPDIDDALEEVEKKGYYRFFMLDVIREELDEYVEGISGVGDDDWTLFTYAPTEVEPGYLGHLYKLVSPSEYFTIDVYFAGGEAMFLFALADSEIPELIKNMEPYLWESSEVTAYDFSYSQESDSYVYYGDVSDFYYGPTEEEAAALTTAAEAEAAFDALVGSELEATVIDDFVAINNYYGSGVLDIDGLMVLVSASYEYDLYLGIIPYNYYFFWDIIVASWPAYPEFLTAEFAEAAGATNYHQFYEMTDGSLTFSKEGASEEQAIAAFNALKALDGATVLSEYSELTGKGRLQFEDLMVTVQYIYEAAEEEGEEDVFGYMVSISEIPEVDPVLVAIDPAIPGVSAFDFQVSKTDGSLYFYAPTEDTTLGSTIFNNILGLASEELSVNVLVPYSEDEGLGRIQVADKQVTVSMYEYDEVLYFQVTVGELPVFPSIVEAAATVLGLSSVYQFQYYSSYEEYIYFPAGVPEDFGAEAEACFNTLATIEGAEVVEEFSYTPGTEEADPQMTGNIVVGNFHLYLDFAEGGNFCVCIGNYYPEPEGEHPYTEQISLALGAPEDYFEWDTSKGCYSLFAEEFGPSEDSLEAVEAFLEEVSPIVLGVAAFEGEEFVASEISQIPQVDYWGDSYTDYEITYESANYVVTIYVSMEWIWGYDADVTFSVQPK